MKINDLNLTGATAAEAGRAQEAQRAERGDSARSPAGQGTGWGDRVELSDALGQLSKAIGADASRRTAMVDRLAADYQAGRYVPDSVATSRGMVSEALGAGL